MGLIVTLSNIRKTAQEPLLRQSSLQVCVYYFDTSSKWMDILYCRECNDM